MKVLPAFLHPGDTVAIVSPSGIVNEAPIRGAVSIMESWGLTVELGKHIFDSEGVFAGSDEHRAADLNEAIRNPRVKAIFCSRGGYGAGRIVRAIDFASLQQSPKWLIGFSDITVFHSALSALGLASIHGLMPNSFEKTDPDSLSFLRSLLFGDRPNYTFAKHELNKYGTAKAPLVGGNLSILYSLRGTPWDIDFKDKILFIEDIGEKLYHLDRMMVNLELGGKLEHLRGLLVGDFSDMTDGATPFAMTAYEIINHYCGKYSYPIVYGVEAGHVLRNLPLLMGNDVTISCNEKMAILRF